MENSPFNWWGKPSTKVTEISSSHYGTDRYPSCLDRRISSAKSLSFICRSTSPFSRPLWEAVPTSKRTKIWKESWTTSRSILTREGRICRAHLSSSNSMLSPMCRIPYSIHPSASTAPRSGPLNCATNWKSSLKSTFPRTNLPRSSIGMPISRRK